MGIKVDPAGKKRMFIETTMIGLAEQSNKLKTGIETLAAGGKNRQSLASFEAACNVASKRFEECKPQFEKTPGYHLLDIEKVRRLGIQPLSSHKVQ